MDSAYFTAELTNKAIFYTFELKSSLEVGSSFVCFPKQQDRLLPIKTLLLSNRTAVAGVAASFRRHGNWPPWTLLSGPASRDGAKFQIPE